MLRSSFGSSSITTLGDFYQHWRHLTKSLKLTSLSPSIGCVFDALKLSMQMLVKNSISATTTNMRDYLITVLLADNQWRFFWFCLCSSKAHLSFSIKQIRKLSAEVPFYSIILWKWSMGIFMGGFLRYSWILRHFLGYRWLGCCLLWSQLRSLQ